MTDRAGRARRGRTLAVAAGVVASCGALLAALGPSWWTVVVGAAIVWTAVGLVLARLVGGAAAMRDRHVLVPAGPARASSSSCR